MIVSLRSADHDELECSPISLLQDRYQSSAPASYPAAVPSNLYIDGYMLGFGILVDESILLKRLHVRTLDGITKESWTRAGLITPTSMTPDAYGVNLAFLLDSPVAMNQPKRAQFFYNMVSQWLHRFWCNCRLIGGPGDYVTVDSDVLSVPRVYTLDGISKVIGKRYRQSQHVPNIAAWTHNSDVLCVRGGGFVDRHGELIGSAARSRKVKPVAAAGSGDVPVCDLLAESDREKRSRGAATKNHAEAYLSLLSIIWTLNDTPHLSVQELVAETGLSSDRVRSYLNRELFAKRVRAGTHALEYEIGGKNAEMHRALLDKAFRSIQSFAIYVFYIGLAGVGSETLATGAAQAQRCIPDSSDLDSFDVGTRPQGKALQPTDGTQSGQLRPFDGGEAATLRLGATVATRGSAGDAFTDIACWRIHAEPIKPAAPRRSAPCLPETILPLCPLGTNGKKETSKSVFNRTSSTTAQARTRHGWLTR